MPESYYPSRWRLPLGALGATNFVLAAVQLLLGSPGWGAIGSALVGASLLLRARRLGVTLSEDGVQLRSTSFFGGRGGLWRWREIEGVDVIEEEYVRNAPQQVVLRVTGGESVRLGPATDREAMVAQIRSRLRPQ